MRCVVDLLLITEGGAETFAVTVIVWYMSCRLKLAEVVEPKLTTGYSVQLREIDHFKEEDLVMRVGQITELRYVPAQNEFRCSF